MKTSWRAEWLPVFALLGGLPLGGAITGACSFLLPEYSLLVLFVTASAGAAAIFFGDWPPIEYGLVLTITLVLAGLLLPVGLQVAVALPGALVGYLWGGILASVLDRPNVERAIRDAQKDRPDG